MKLKEIKEKIGYIPLASVLIFIIIIIHSFYYREYLDPSEYSELNRQLTPDKKYYIYEYTRPGGMSFGGDIYGCRIIEKDKRFAEDEGKDFPYGIVSWLSKDTILVSNGLEYGTINGIVIKNDTPEYFKSFQYGPCEFDSLTVSNDSIKILGIHGADVTSIVCPKGPITISPHAGMISTLRIRDRRTRYDSNKKLQIEWNEYELIPNASIPIKTLGETGFFLSVK